MLALHHLLPPFPYSVFLIQGANTPSFTFRRFLPPLPRERTHLPLVLLLWPFPLSPIGDVLGWRRIRTPTSSSMPTCHPHTPPPPKNPPPRAPDTFYIFSSRLRGIPPSRPLLSSLFSLHFGQAWHHKGTLSLGNPGRCPFLSPLSLPPPLSDLLPALGVPVFNSLMSPSPTLFNFLVSTISSKTNFLTWNFRVRLSPPFAFESFF